jgi:DNA-binding transcriptional regulator YdaS (Cro superfamily)
MRKDDLIQHFGTSIAVAKALGVTKSAVSQWGDIVPEGVAYKAQVVTGGILCVDTALYPKPHLHADTAA